ncbi:Flp pilus assembly protein TadG [Streptacidiphilus sp. MAP12-33]|uniref:hypothetical protein n=1 Tax=Streptacidiphilus sp. MAP12-33 TaxID=3156266 RepID=UPI00351116D5
MAIVLMALLAPLFLLLAGLAVESRLTLRRRRAAAALLAEAAALTTREEVRVGS